VPIASVAQDYLAVVVSTKLPAESLDQLVATARSRPGELNWAAAPGAPYLTFLEFQRRAGIDLAYVPYRGSSLALPDLIAGEIQVAVTPLASALALARDRKLKLLAVSTMQRSPTAPEIPTVGEAGHPELTVEAPLGLFGPKGMSHELRTRIAADVAAVAHEPEVRARLETAGLLAQASTPDEYAAVLAEQRTRWAALARALGVSAQ
jgi:tripartite-type tricarboxylate transporter receptor subunit TctC